MFLEECKNCDYEEKSDEKTLEKFRRKKILKKKIVMKKTILKKIKFFSRYIKDGK